MSQEVAGGGFHWVIKVKILRWKQFIGGCFLDDAYSSNGFTSAEKAERKKSVVSHSKFLEMRAYVLLALMKAAFI